MRHRIPPWFATLITAALLAPGTPTLALPGEDSPTTAADTTTPEATKPPAPKPSSKFPRLVRSDRQWRALLEPNQYLATRRGATEQAFTGIYWNHHDDGVYTCAGCGTPLFDSLAKFNSGTGWPSYWRTIDRNFLRARPDISNGQPRTEVLCRVCDAHLGHVFNDGPRPTGLRFCINSASLVFVPRPHLPEHLDHWKQSLGLAPDASQDHKPDTAGTETKPTAEAPGTPETPAPGAKPEPEGRETSQKGTPR